MKRFIPILCIVLVLVIQVATLTWAQESGLQGYWTLDEVSGQRQDSSGNDNSLADHNTVGSAPGQVDLAADFERNNSEYLSISDANQSGLDITGDMSILFWIRPESVSSSMEYQMVSKYRTGDNQRAYRIVIGVTTSAIRTNLSGNGSAVTTAEGGTALVAGNWYYVAVVYNGTDIRVYLNGELDSNGADNPRAYSGGIYNSAAAFQVGIQDGGSYYYDGLLDELRIYDRALSVQEINDVMNGATPTSTSTSTSTLTATPTGTGTATPTPTGTIVPIGTPTPDVVITNTLSSGDIWALRREVSYGQAAVVVIVIVLIGIRILGAEQ